MGKKTKTPDAIDPFALGEMQKVEDAGTLQRQLDQIHGTGQKTTEGGQRWVQDANGNWNQETYLNQPNQDLYNQQLNNRQQFADLAGIMSGQMNHSQIQLNKGTAQNGLPGIADYNSLGKVPGAVDYSALGAIPGAANYGSLGAMPSVADYSKLGALPGQVDYNAQQSKMPTVADYASLGDMPKVGQYNQQATDLTRQLMQPSLDATNDAARARAAAMGLGAGSGAGNNFMEYQNSQRSNDAALKSALAGINQGNIEFGQGMDIYKQGAQNLTNQFNQGLAARQQGSSEMSNQFAQALAGRQQGANELTNQFNQGLGLRQQGVSELNNLFNQNMMGYQQGAQNLNNQFGQNMQGYQQGAQNLNNQFNQGMGLNQQEMANILQQNNAILGERQGNLGYMSGLMGLAGNQSAVPTLPGMQQLPTYQGTDWNKLLQQNYAQQLDKTNAGNADNAASAQTGAAVGSLALAAAAMF